MDEQQALQVLKIQLSVLADLPSVKKFLEIHEKFNVLTASIQKAKETSESIAEDTSS